MARRAALALFVPLAQRIEGAALERGVYQPGAFFLFKGHRTHQRLTLARDRLAARFEQQPQLAQLARIDAAGGKQRGDLFAAAPLILDLGLQIRLGAHAGGEGEGEALLQLLFLTFAQLQHALQTKARHRSGSYPCSSAISFSAVTVSA